MAGAEDAGAFERIRALLGREDAAHALHAHAPTRTMDEARENLDFAPERIVKTIAFQAREGFLVLAALRGTRRVDYPALAALLGLKRRDLSSLSPAQVLERLGVEPGCVAPLAVWQDRAGGDVRMVVDEDVLAIAPTAYCGTGRADRTLELAPEALLRLAGGRMGRLSRPAE